LLSTGSNWFLDYQVRTYIICINIYDVSCTDAAAAHPLLNYLFDTLTRKPIGDQSSAMSNATNKLLLLLSLLLCADRRIKKLIIRHTLAYTYTAVYNTYTPNRFRVAVVSLKPFSVRRRYMRYYNNIIWLFIMLYLHYTYYTLYYATLKLITNITS